MKDIEWQLKCAKGCGETRTVVLPQGQVPDEKCCGQKMYVEACKALEPVNAD